MWKQEKRLQGIEAQMLELMKQCKNADLTEDDMIAMIRLLYSSETMPRGREE